MAEPIEQLIAATLDIPISWVNDELEYQSLPQWDSLQHAALMVTIEETYNLKIDPDLTLELTSFPKIKAFIQSLGYLEYPSDRCRAVSLPMAQGTSQDGHAALVPRLRHGTRREISQAQVHRGLEGIIFDRTHISLIEGQTGTLLYRGYSIHDLAQCSTFEETAYLLIHGKLPTTAELRALEHDLRDARCIPGPVTEIILAMRAAHPMDALRTVISALGTFDPERMDNSPEATRRKGLRLMAQVPTAVAMHHALGSSQIPVAPHESLTHAANFLYMLQRVVPSARAARLIDKDLILHAEHGSNASTFAARIAAGTCADIHAAITAAVATFSGPLHGGAVENVIQMIEDIGEPHRAADYVRHRLIRKHPIMGFGHRVYRVEDPRVRYFREAAKELSAELGDPKWYEILETVVREMQAYSRHGIHANVDLYAGLVYHLLGIPHDLSVPVFVVSRVAGWVAHVLEQLENNILIRPLLHYVGEVGASYSPATERETGRWPGNAADLGSERSES